MENELWFYEQKRTGGGWAPCTVPQMPNTLTVNGFLCLRRLDGSTGPRVRRITKVDPALHGLSLEDLARVLPGGGD